MSDGQQNDMSAQERGQDQCGSPPDADVDATAALAGWFVFADFKPTSGTKIVGLYDDGSGAALYFVHDGGFIDHDGDEHDLLTCISHWAYLPTGFTLYCEGCPEEGFNFPKHVHPSDAARGAA